MSGNIKSNMPYSSSLKIELCCPLKNAFYRQLLQPFIKTTHYPPRLFHRIHELMNREQFEPTGLVDNLLTLPAKNIHEPIKAGSQRCTSIWHSLLK